MSRDEMNSASCGAIVSCLSSWSIRSASRRVSNRSCSERLPRRHRAADQVGEAGDVPVQGVPVGPEPDATEQPEAGLPDLGAEGADRGVEGPLAEALDACAASAVREAAIEPVQHPGPER